MSTLAAVIRGAKALKPSRPSNNRFYRRPYTTGEKKSHAPYSEGLDSASVLTVGGAMDPRTLEDNRRTKRNIWILGMLAAGTAVGYQMSTNDYYSQKKLMAFSPESLDEDSQAEIHSSLRAVAAMCVTNAHIESDIMKSPSYSALRKGVYSNDKYIRLLSIRALAALARSSREVRKRIAQTMDFTRLSAEISGDNKLKAVYESDGEMATTLMRKYSKSHQLKLGEDSEDENSVRPGDLDALLAFAYDDIVSSVTMTVECHPKLLEMQYQEHLAKMAKSPSFFVRSAALRGIAGLTRSVEGRQALARTDVFPTLYNLIYDEKNKDVLISPENVNFGKFALQQLLLSESALDIMLPKYEPFFMSMTRDAKEDMLMKFDLNDDNDYDQLVAAGKQVGVGLTFGLLWGALRSVLRSQYVPGQKRPEIRFNNWRRILIGSLNGSTGSLPLIAGYLLITHLNQRFLSRYQDATGTYYTSGVGIASAFGAAAVLFVRVFPLSIVPAFVGINAPTILSAIDGTWEHERAKASFERAGTPNSDQL